MTEEKILARIRKLLAVGNDDRANENERENALRMAQAMMLKHEVDQAMLSKADRDASDPRGVWTNATWNMVWCRSIHKSIGKLFFCKYLEGDKINATRGEHIFIGRESNATTAMFMAEWIVRSVLREGTRRYGHNLHPDTRSFALGVAYRLSQRVTEMLTKTEAPVLSDGRSLVILEHALTEEVQNLELARQKFNIVKRKNRSVTVGATYHEGRKYADTINLNKQVSSQVTKALK